MSVKDNFDGTWSINMTASFSPEALERVAEGIEEGEVLSGFVLTIPGENYDRLDPKLVKRLGPFLRRGE